MTVKNPCILLTNNNGLYPSWMFFETRNVVDFMDDERNELHDFGIKPEGSCPARPAADSYGWK